MGLPVARVGDQGVGTCFCHRDPIPMTGVIVNGSTTVLTNGLPTARVGDTVQGGCGHSGTIVDGSMTVLTNGIPTARMSSQFVGCFVGKIVTGSLNVYVP